MLILSTICAILLFVILVICCIFMNTLEQEHKNLITEYTILEEELNREKELNKKLEKELELEKQINISTDKIEKKTRTRKTSKK